MGWSGVTGGPNVRHPQRSHAPVLSAVVSASPTAISITPGEGFVPQTGEHEPVPGDQAALASLLRPSRRAAETALALLEGEQTVPGFFEDLDDHREPLTRLPVAWASKTARIEAASSGDCSRGGARAAAPDRSLLRAPFNQSARAVQRAGSRDRSLRRIVLTQSPTLTAAMSAGCTGNGCQKSSALGDRPRCTHSVVRQLTTSSCVPPEAHPRKAARGACPLVIMTKAPSASVASEVRDTEALRGWCGFRDPELCCRSLPKRTLDT